MEEKKENLDRELLKKALLRRKLLTKFNYLIPFGLAFYGLIGLFLSVFFPDFLGTNGRTFQILLGSMGTIGLFWLMSKYLETSRNDINPLTEKGDFNELLDILKTSTYRNEDRFKEMFYTLSEKIEKIREENKSILLNPEEQKALYEKVQNSLSQNLNAGFYNEIESAIKKSILEQKREETYNATKSYDDAIKRLKSEIIILGKRANLNLIIGTMISLAALFLLGYFVLREDFNSSELLKVLLHFVPRLSLVIFIELFSFFFLKLYRASLAEIKYYQNELTNIELRQISLLAAFNRGNQEDLSIVIKELINTERNFKLIKGESTVELEKNKLENKSLKDLISVAFGNSKTKAK